MTLEPKGTSRERCYGNIPSNNAPKISMLYMVVHQAASLPRKVLRIQLRVVRGMRICVIGMTDRCGKREREIGKGRRQKKEIQAQTEFQPSEFHLLVLKK